MNFIRISTRRVVVNPPFQLLQINKDGYKLFSTKRKKIKQIIDYYLHDYILV